MANYKEIVTKAVIDKGKKTFTSNTIDNNLVEKLDYEIIDSEDLEKYINN